MLARCRTPSKGDVPQLDPLLSLAKGLRSPSRRPLREEGLFTVLAAFDDPSFTDWHRERELEIGYEPRSFTLRLPDGEELQRRRDLSSFVGKVYLPCRCGEVASVLVPPVTACTGSGGD